MVKVDLWVAIRWTVALAAWPLLLILPPFLAILVGAPWSVIVMLMVSTMPLASIGSWWLSGIPLDGSPDQTHRTPQRNYPYDVWGLGVLVFTVIAVSALTSMVAPGADQPAANLIASMGSWMSLILLVNGAVGEELLCRGLVWSILTRIGLNPLHDQGWIPVRSLSRAMIAAAIFAVLHMDIHHGIAVFPLGVLFGVIRARYGLWAAILAHVVNNVGAWLLMPT